MMVSSVPRKRAAFTLVEMMMAMAVFGIATLGMWECIRTNFLLAAKNTGLNLSHTALQATTDQLAGMIRNTLQVIDVGTFDGTTYTPINESNATGASASGNAIRFLRVMPCTFFLLPDDGKNFTETNPQDPHSVPYPDYLTAGNHTVKATYNTAASNLTDPSFLADLNGSRLFLRFPYLVDWDGLPGLDLTGTPQVTGTNQTTMSLTYGLPTTVKVPSCNQAFLVLVSEVAVLNRGTGYSEMVYYPDITNLSRNSSMTRSLAVSTTGPGPMVFSLPKTAGPLTDPSARGSVNVTLPVNAPDLNNTVVRRGGTAALTNIAITIPIELRRRSTF